MEWNIVVAILCIEHGFLHLLRDLSRRVKRRLSVMCFSGGMEVDRLEVNGTPGYAVLFGAEDHVVAPCYWFSNGKCSNSPSLTSRSKPV